MNSSVQKTMKTFFWLVRREFWENKAIFLWLPVALSLGFFVMFLVVEISFKEFLSENRFKELQRMFGDAEALAFRMKNAVNITFSVSQFILHTLLVVSAFLSSFYLFSSLNGDRRDRSILFWKSMPVSDHLQVVVKLVFPLLLTPVLVIVLGFLSYFCAALIVAVLSVFGPINLFASILANQELYLTPLTYLSLLPFYFFWALPTVGWFLLVSSVARSRVFPWAVGVPILSTIICFFLNGMLKLQWDTAWIVKSLLARLIAANIPGIWVLELSPAELEASKHQPLGMTIGNVPWSSASLWWGVLFGVVMMMIAIRVRKRADVLN